MIIPKIWENKIDVPNHQPAMLNEDKKKHFNRPCVAVGSQFQIHLNTISMEAQ